MPIVVDRRRLKRRRRARWRLARAGMVGLLRRDIPILVQMIPMRRCNLACKYCNEYDDVSSPVPAKAMIDRIDHLAALGTRIISFSGGEPLLHPQLDDLIRRIKHHGIFAELLTNGYLLGPRRIAALNGAGLDRLQISVDNVTPDPVSKKSLHVLDRKLRHLASHADFDVNINAVVGGGNERAEDALEVTKRALELGFTSTVGIIHDGHGQLKPLPPKEREVYFEIRRRGVSFGPLVKFKDNLVDGKPNDWRCRAGARYLYVCENGLVHYCSQQRGFPGTPLLEYTTEDIRRHFNVEKGCAPLCTVSCVHSISPIDHWRGSQTEGVFSRGRPEDLVQIGGTEAGPGPGSAYRATRS